MTYLKIGLKTLLSFEGKTFVLNMLDPYPLHIKSLLEKVGMLVPQSFHNDCSICVELRETYSAFNHLIF